MLKSVDNSPKMIIIVDNSTKTPKSPYYLYYRKYRKRGNNMRNVQKTADKGRAIIKKRNRLDLTNEELNQFYEAFNEKASKNGVCNALLNTIDDAYKMGIAVGMRNA